MKLIKVRGITAECPPCSGEGMVSLDELELQVLYPDARSTDVYRRGCHTCVGTGLLHKMQARAYGRTQWGTEFVDWDFALVDPDGVVRKEGWQCWYLECQELVRKGTHYCSDHEESCSTESSTK